MIEKNGNARLHKYKRAIFPSLVNRFSEPRRFIQVLSGPRQTGKTTLARQLMDHIDYPCTYASADEPALKGLTWIEQQWELIRAKEKQAGGKRPGLIILDEIHKIPGWSETVKRLWDEDSAAGMNVRALLLGSAPLLVQRGLTESLAGRFESIPVSHWSYGEMQAAFGWGLEQYLYFGGYPGAAPLAGDHERWSRYITDSLIETTLSRDILLMTRIDKPALLRRLFELGCSYSGQVLSYQKMLGQLHDAGNTTTLAHYLSLLGGAGLLTGLSKYAGQKVRQRASSPKLLVLNTALMTAQSGYRFEEAKRETDFRGKLIETAVGACLANGIQGKDIELHYWSGRNREVDFVLKRGRKLTAIEVKSGRTKTVLPGIEAFSGEFKATRKILVGAGGIPLEDFLLADPREWL